MSELINNFHFLRPGWLLLLFLPIFFYWRYYQGSRNQSSWEKVCDPNLLNYLLVRGSSKQRKVISYLGLWGMISAILAASGPSWKKTEVPNLQPENPVMIVLNLSSEMSQKDLTPSRLERAKYKITDLLQLLHNAQTGMIVYADEPFLITPITDDTKIIANLLPEIKLDIMPGNGGRLDRAIDFAAEKLKNAGYKQGNIVIFTPDVDQRLDLALEAAQRAAAENYKVDIVEINGQEAEKLKLIAERGQGMYLKIHSDDRDMQKLAQQINSESGELKISENLRSQWQDAGYYLLLLPLICTLYFFRKGIVWAWLVAFLAFPAQAGFFLNSNQEALRDFDREDYQAAAQKFKDPKWLAASQYRLGDYAAALQNFAQEQGATAIYNQGNALAKTGKIDEAIKKYEEVLQLEPDNEDAKFNLEYLKQQKQDQQSEQNQEQNQQEQEKQEQDQEQKQDQDQNKDQEQKQQDQAQQEQSESGQKSEESSPEQQPEENKTSSTSQAPEQVQEQELDDQDQPSAQANAQPEKDQKYDEEAQARAQQFREIPEDPGGLLRAFINKEYLKQRYKQ